MKKSNIIKKLAKTGIVVGIIGGIIYIKNKELKQVSNVSARYKSYYDVLVQWLSNENTKEKIEQFMADNEIKSVAIYGMGRMGELFYKEMKETSIKNEYFIDMNAKELYMNEDKIPVVNIEQISNQNKVDAIIITPVYDKEEINKKLVESGCKIPTISIDTIIEY